VSDDLILMPEVQARRILGDRPIRLQMLAPYGAWIGRGALRVLRTRMLDAQGDKEVELTVGYESYQPHAEEPRVGL
jgi:hypothetical protein